MNKFLNNRYTLYNKNKRILDFHCERNEHDEVHFVTDKEYPEKKPFNFQSIDYWVGNRRAPRNRAHINEILRKCGCLDLEGFIRFTYGASLNDTFWVKPEESDLTWERVSFYRNKFDENIAKIAFDGGLMGDGLSSPSPELITDGTVAKCWRRIGDDVVLLKRGAKLSKNEEIYGYGPFSEKYSFELAQHICQNPLEYDVIKYHAKIASVCKLFCDENVSYAPTAYVLGEKAKFKECLEFFESIGYGENFREMIVLDALTFNEDRHLKNFGVLFDADTLDILGMAPVFDNNLALFPNNLTCEMKNLSTFLPNRTSAFGIPFDDLLRSCMTPSIKKKLINLQGFKFSRDGKYALDEERLSCLEKIVEHQIDVALGRKQYVVDKKDRVIKCDGISVTFDANKISPPDENEVIISNFELLTESGEILSVSQCKFDIITSGDIWEVDIYEATISGDSESLMVEEIRDFNLSISTSHKLEIPANDTSIQLSDGVKIAISSPKVMASFRPKQSKSPIMFGLRQDKPSSLSGIPAKSEEDEEQKPKTDWNDD